MGKELVTYGSQFTFIQLRISAEHFVVPLCGLAVERVLRLSKPGQYHLYFEKRLPRFKQGPVDMVLTPIAGDGKDDLENAYCFEFKMVWLKSIKQNIYGVTKDIEKLGRYYRGYIVAILFSFDRKLNWAPYSHKGDMKHLVKETIAGVGIPLYEGNEYIISNHEVTGNLKLIAWAASR